MRQVMRVLVGIAGALGLLLAARLWLDPAAMGGKLGLVGQGALGAATLRADLGGFFAVAGVLALAAAIRADGRLITAPLMMVAIALAGRLVTVVTGAYDAQALPAILVEAVLVLVFGLGRRLLPSKV